MGLTLAMAALIGSIVSGIAAAGSNIYSAYSAREAQKEANQANIDLTAQANASQLQQVQAVNDFNAAEAQKARDWNEYMSNTQVQRAMSDYQAAGLNPLLAASNGAAYSAPASASGAVAQVQRAQVSPAYLDLTGISSAMQSISNTMLISALVGNNKSINAGSMNQVLKAIRASH